MYFIDSKWATDGNLIVKDGEGQFERYGELHVLLESGKVSGGLRQGEWTTYYPSGEKAVMSTAHYVNGKAEGLTKSFYEDGTLQLEGEVRNEKRAGTWKWYHQNTSLETSVEFKAGKKEGTQLFYFDDGTVSRTEEYKEGELVESMLEL